MKGKILFVAGLSVGYVLGSRAGRKRYDQIAAAARKVWETPGIQRQVRQAQDFAAAQVGDIPGVLVDAGKKLVSSVVSSQRSSASAVRRDAAKTREANETQEEKPAASAKQPAKTAAKPTAKKSAATKSAASTATKKPATKRPSGRASSTKDGE